jgi:hypothetical protein
MKPFLSFSASLRLCASLLLAASLQGQTPSVKINATNGALFAPGFTATQILASNGVVTNGALTAVSNSLQGQITTNTSAITAVGNSLTNYTPTSGINSAALNTNALILTNGGSLETNSWTALEQGTYRSVSIGTNVATDPVGWVGGYNQLLANSGYTTTNLAAWYISGSLTIGTNSGTLPDGGTGTFFSLNYGGLTGGSQITVGVGTVAHGTNTYTAQIWMRAASNTGTIYLMLQDAAADPSAGNYATATCNLSTNWQLYTVTNAYTSGIGNACMTIGYDSRAGTQTSPAITVQALNPYLSTSTGPTKYTSTGVSYKVAVEAGACVVGNQLFYPSSLPVTRTFNGSSWTTRGGEPQKSVIASFGYAGAGSTSTRPQQLQIFTTPDYGQTLTQLGASQVLFGGNFVRDPNIISTNGAYYIAATAQWITNYFNVLTSTDLVNWSVAAKVPAPTNCITTWSPCFFTDTNSSLHVFFSASPTQSAGYANANQYYETHPTVATNLAAAWSTPTNIVVTNIPSGYGTNQFGNAILKVGSNYDFFTITGPGESVYLATATNLMGPYTAITNYPSISGLPQIDGLQRIVQLPNGTYRLLYDPQGDVECYADSTDLTNWILQGYLAGTNSYQLDNSSILPLTQQAQNALNAAGVPQVGTLMPTSFGTLAPASSCSYSAGTLPNQTNISITALHSSGTTNGATITATVASTAALSTGMTPYISGASDNAFNGEFPITVVNTTNFTYTATSSPGTTNPTGTIVLQNLWVTLFDGPGTSECNGLVSVQIGAAGSRHALLLGITGALSGISAKVISSSGYGWPQYVRVSSLSTSYRVEVRIPAIVGYSFQIAATYQPLAGVAIPGEPLTLNSPGPLYVGAPRVWAGGMTPYTYQCSVPTPALAAGATGYSYWSPAPLPVFDGLNPMSVPSATLTFNYPGLPGGLILQSITQGAGANCLSLQFFNPTTNSIGSNSVTGTLNYWPQ